MTKKAKKGGKIWLSVCFILTLGLSIMLADFCSNLITIKAFSNSASISGQNAYDIYAISLHSSATKTTALEQASTQQKQSGAGFIWQQGNKFYTLASAYSEENDARLVKENLEKENQNAEIIKIHIDAIIFNSNYTNQELNTLVSAITIYKLVFDNLYDISVALDTKVNTEPESLLFVSDVHNLVSKTKLNLEALFASSQTSEIVYIKLSLSDLYKKIEDLKNHPQNTTSVQTFSSKLKQTYLETIELNYNLAKNI